MVNLIEIDKLIENCWQEQMIETIPFEKTDEVRDQIFNKLSSYLSDFVDIYSKKEADILAPSYQYNHKIELKKEGKPLIMNPLYQMNLEQLQLMKKYLFKHLNKEFIVNNNSSFTAPILFVKKSNKNWRFCIDYKQLNSYIEIDLYPLSFINEMLVKLQEITIFIKIDIRHIFTEYILNIKIGAIYEIWARPNGGI